jgi:hypothetical protein
MANLPYEFRRATERALRSYPEIKAELRRLDRYTEAICSPDQLDGDRVDGGVSVAIQERVAAARSKMHGYSVLAERCEAVEAAYRALPRLYQDFVQLHFWDELRFDEIAPRLFPEKPEGAERSLWRIKDKTISVCASYVLGAWGRAEVAE